MKNIPRLLWALVLLAAPMAALAAGDGASFQGMRIGGVPVEFVLFALTLAGVAIFHHHTLPIALGGVALIALYKIVASPSMTGAGLHGFVLHVEHEWVILANLLLLLVGFALLAQFFQESRIPDLLPNYLRRSVRSTPRSARNCAGPSARSSATSALRPFSSRTTRRRHLRSPTASA